MLLQLELMSRWEHRDKNHSKYKHTLFGWFLLLLNSTILIFMAWLTEIQEGITLVNYLFTLPLATWVLLFILPMSRKLRYVSTLRYQLFDEQN